MTDIPPASPPPSLSPSPLAPPAATSPLDDIEKNKVFAVIAYLGLLWLVPLLAAQDSPFARYHANQGIVLFICFAIAAACCVPFILIPFVGCLVFPFLALLAVAHLLLVILGIINAAQGRCVPLPLIGQWTLLK
jgi:uncharacterized membrane protein